MDLSWILTFLVGLITFFLAKHYLKTRHLPPGPFPLPVVGNLLSFKGKQVSDVLNNYRKKYGDIFTVWLGNKCFVFVCKLSLIKEAMLDRRCDFAGRVRVRSTQIFLDGHTSIADSQFSNGSETLRKMGLSALRKYTVSEEIPPLVDQVTQGILKKMVHEKEPFDPKDHFYFLISNLIASSLIGKRYASDDPEFLAFRGVAETTNEIFGKGFMIDFLPFLQPFYRKQEQQLKESSHAAISLMLDKFKQHMATYEPGLIRDMMDSLICAREETIAEGKEAAIHMNDTNMAYVSFDLYFAGVETSSFTLRWIIMFLATHQDVQKKVIQEIQDRIGDRMPVQDDKKYCPYTTAVIYETMRFRTVVPQGLPRAATCDSQIGEYKIRNGTNVVVCIDMVHKDPTQWEEPEKFKPERFLDADGNFTEKRISQFMTFGQGRRSCIGDKLAIVNLFLILTGIFRKYQIEMKVPPVNMNPNPDFFFFSFAPGYKITVKPI